MSKNIFLIIYDGKIIKNLYYTLLLLYKYFFKLSSFSDFNPIVSESCSRNIPTHYK